MTLWPTMALENATPVDTSQPDNPVVRTGSTVKVKTTVNSKTIVRKGTVVQEDPKPTDGMPYKVEFHDEMFPKADWFHPSVVEHHAPSVAKMRSATLSNGHSDVASEWTEEGLEMIVKHHGQYSQIAGWSSITGNYLCLTNGEIKEDSDSGNVSLGTFSCRRINDEHAMVPSAFVAAPCVQIVDSDVIVEMQRPENEGVFFVLPSSSAERLPEIEVPRGLLGAHPALAAFVRDNAVHTSPTQGVNALREVSAEMKKSGVNFEFVNGCLKAPQVDETRQADALQALRTSMRHLRVPILEDIPACGVLPDGNGFSDAKHTVNLVYAPAAISDSRKEATDPDKKDFQAEVAEILLVGHYYGALQRAAARGDDTKIFLMPLTLQEAHCMSTAIDRMGADELNKVQIYILISGPHERSRFAEIFRDHGKLGPSMRQLEATSVKLDADLSAAQPKAKSVKRAAHRVVSDFHGRSPEETFWKVLFVKFLFAVFIFAGFHILAEESSRIESWMGPSCACLILTFINVWTLNYFGMLEWY